MGSVFDIIGPIMIGPSSSHTAGAARLGKMARYILREEPAKVTMTLYGSFAKTYKGHGTNKALVAGLLGLEADDGRIPSAFEMAAEDGLQYEFIESDDDAGHPNVVAFDMVSVTGKTAVVTGRSLGGGKILVTEIDHMAVEVTGEEYTLMTFHQDKPGVIAGVTKMLADQNINISSMRVFRKQKHIDAVMIIQTDSIVEEDTLQQIRACAAIQDVMSFEPL